MKVCMVCGDAFRDHVDFCFGDGSSLRPVPADAWATFGVPAEVVIVPLPEPPAEEPPYVFPFSFEEGPPLAAAAVRRPLVESVEERSYSHKSTVEYTYEDVIVEDGFGDDQATPVSAPRFVRPPLERGQSPIEALLRDASAMVDDGDGDADGDDDDIPYDPAAAMPATVPPAEPRAARDLPPLPEAARTGAVLLEAEVLDFEPPIETPEPAPEPPLDPEVQKLIRTVEAAVRASVYAARRREQRERSAETRRKLLSLFWNTFG